VYQYGQSDKESFVGSWLGSGRGAQLVKIADALLKSAILLSALMLLHMESHPKSDLTDFIAAILNRKTIWPLSRLLASQACLS
jgi:hypothetical protein